MAEAEKSIQDAERAAERATSTLSPNVYLDRIAQNVASGTPVVLREGDTWMIGSVVSTEDVSVSAFTVSGRVTKLHLADAPDGASFGLRTTTVYLQAEELPLARKPMADPVNSGSKPLALEGWVDGLAKGQSMIVSGELATAPGTHASEPVTIESVSHMLDPDDGGTSLTLIDGLQNSYLRNTVRINANVAHATHGETVTEVL